MSTRSAILIENEDGSAEGIYCHNDGYLEHNGRILLEAYTDEAKVRKLINLGDISVLGESLGEKHDSNYDEEGVVTAYGRDRGEDSVEKKVGKSWRDVVSVIDHNGHVYIWKAGRWLYTKGEMGPGLLTAEMTKAPGAR